jgi:hypothetical protein
VYTEPPAGWAGVVHPAARLITDRYTDELAFSGSTVAIGSYQPPTSRYDSCPCAGGVLIFTEPAGGWHGILTAPQSLTTTTTGQVGIDLAIDANTVLAGGLIIPRSQTTDTGVFAVSSPIVQTLVRPGRPTLREFQLSGLANDKPTLAFTLAPGAYAPPLASLRVTLPPGLRFNRNSNRLRHAIKLEHAVLAATRIVRGRLIIEAHLGRPTVIHIGKQALTEGQTLLSRVKRLRRRHQQRDASPSLRFALRATDAAGTGTRLSVTEHLG